MENDLISSNQSGYKPNGSSINQLLPIPHEIYKFVHCDYGVSDVFLDNSKAFDKIQLNGVVFKLKHGVMSSKLRMILQDYLDEPKERVVLNGQVFSWAKAKVEVPLVQSLVQCFFHLHYLNHLPPLFKVRMRSRKNSKKGGGEIFYKNWLLAKMGNSVE